MQNFERLYSYIHEFQYLVYEYYAKTGVAFLTTYWNINKDETIWEDEKMFGGAYERTGTLSGVKFDKYLLLPVYFIEDINVAFNAEETGQHKAQETEIVFPSVYGITPYPGDCVKLEQEYLRPVNDTYPIFRVSGVEIHPNTDRRFWKLKIEAFQLPNIQTLNRQTIDTKVFYDYDKKVHTVDESTFLTVLMDKNEILRERLTNMWDKNTGLYTL